MAEEEKTVYVFEQRGAENVQRELKGIADKFSVTQRDADKAAAEIRDLKRYLEFAKGIKSADDLKKKMNEFPALMTKVSGLTRNLKDKEIKGLAGAFSNLTAAEKKQITQLQQYHVQVKKTTGISNAFTQGIRNAIPTLGMMGTGVGALTVIFQRLTRFVGEGIRKIREFIESSIGLGAEQEEGRTIMQALIGDIEAGTKAYDEFDDRVTNSPFKREAYNIRDYAAAVKIGMGQAYLDAAEAGDVYNFSAASFIENMYKMENGLLRSVNTLGQFSAVLEHTGLSIDDLKDGTISYKEIVEAMKVAVAEMADEQNRAAGVTGKGALNLIRNYWYDIKEQIGEALIQYLKPFGVEILKILKDARQLKDVWYVIGMMLKTVFVPYIAGPAINAMKTIVALMKTFQWSAEKGAAAWGFIARAMGREVKGAPAPATGEVKPSGYEYGLEGGGVTTAKDRQLYEEYTRYQRGEPGPYSSEMMQKYGVKIGGAEKAGGGGRIPTKPGAAFITSTVQGLPRYPELELPPIAEPTAQEQARTAGQKLAAIESKRKKEAEAKVLADAMEDAKVKAAVAASFGIGIKNALMSGDVKQGFQDLGIQIANKLLEALIVGGIFQIFGAATGFGGGFMGVLGGGFEGEGLVERPTFAPIAERTPEFVLKPSTVSAIRQGFNPRGGRAGYGYGPEDYAGGGQTFIIKQDPRAGALVDLSIYRASRRGGEIAGQREA
jgi:hypothetical protein